MDQEAFTTKLFKISLLWKNHITELLNYVIDNIYLTLTWWKINWVMIPCDFKRKYGGMYLSCTWVSAGLRQKEFSSCSSWYMCSFQPLEKWWSIPEKDVIIVNIKFVVRQLWLSCRKQPSKSLWINISSLLWHPASCELYPNSMKTFISLGKREGEKDCVMCASKIWSCHTS